MGFKEEQEKSVCLTSRSLAFKEEPGIQAGTAVAKQFKGLALVSLPGGEMVHLSENEGIENRRFVVTGGTGFVGRALCLELARRGAAEVRSFDKSASPEIISLLQQHGVKCLIGDVRRKEDVAKAFKQANCVFHLASFGMSGKEMLQTRQIDEVNVDGTFNVLDSCVTCGVERLVYTSTYNVVFGGKEIINGHESMEYYPLDDHVDPYGRSKALAEQLVLKYNNRPLKNREGRKLYTCSLRPAAIYGPGEERHFPRILKLAELGLYSVNIGGPDTKQDWVYVDNLVHSQLLASMALLDDIPDRGAKAPAAGQAYFISDGAPINTGKFLRPFLEGLGYKSPQRQLGVETAMRLAWFFWGLGGLFYPWLGKSWLPQPLILPAEVYKVGVTHYFSLLKARQQLGYVPIVDPEEAMKRTITYFKAKQDREVPSPSFLMYFLVISGLIALFISAYVPRKFQGPFILSHYLGLLIFRSTFGMRVAFLVAMAAHALEAKYAWNVALKEDPGNAWQWYWQTFAVGSKSLFLLKKRVKSRKEQKQS